MKDICNLTKAKGKFVKSHLLPKALTRPSQPGAPLIESGCGRPPIRRWDSWYDKKLVTRDGEDILSAFDNAGIAELRKHGLLWGAVRAFQTAPRPDFLDEKTGVGTRIIRGVNTHAIRMFFLSLLWRCAASKRQEMKDISLSAERLEDLRLMLTENRHTPNTIYPFTLTQLLTPGPRHNLAPSADELPTWGVDGGMGDPIPVFRFYLDGLIANVVREKSANEMTMPFKESENVMLVLTVRTEESSQMLNLVRHVIENPRSER